MKTSEVDLRSLTPHARNLNKGTERGHNQLRHSIKRTGLGRSIVVDKHNRIIAGNHAAEAAIDLGKTKGVIVETRGDELVIVKRVDLDLADGKKAVELALADNRVQEVNFDLDKDALLAEIADGLEVEAYFREGEIEEEKKKDEKKSNSIRLNFQLPEAEEFIRLVNQIMHEQAIGSIEGAVMFAVREAAK